MSVVTEDFTIVTADTFARTDIHGVNPYVIHDYITPEDSLSWGNVTPGDNPDGFQYLAMIPACSYGEYDNSSIYNRANYDYMIANYSDYVVQIGRSTHDGLAIALVVGSVVPASLVEIIEGLADYPVIDDEVYEIEAELRNEAIENWVAWDLRCDLLDLDDTLDDAIDAADLIELFDDVELELEIYGYAETSCSWVWGRSDWAGIVAGVAAKLR